MAEAGKRERKTRWDSQESEASTSIVAPLPQREPSAGSLLISFLLIISENYYNTQMLGTGAGITTLPQSTGSGDTRVYVGSMHYDIQESDIRMLFSSFGTIRSIDMSHEPMTGLSSYDRYNHF
jgi:hypothetical protein